MIMINVRSVAPLLICFFFISPACSHTLKLADGRSVSANVSRLNESILVYEDRYGRKAIPVSEVVSIEFKNEPVTLWNVTLGIAVQAEAGQLNFQPILNHISVSSTWSSIGVYYYTPGVLFLSAGVRVPLNDGWVMHVDWMTDFNRRGSPWLGLGKHLAGYHIKASFGTAEEGVQLSVARDLAKL